MIVVVEMMMMLMMVMVMVMVMMVMMMMMVIRLMSGELMAMKVLLSWEYHICVIQLY